MFGEADHDYCSEFSMSPKRKGPGSFANVASASASVPNNNNINSEVRTSDQLLAQLVRGYPFLYEKQHKDFKDSLMKENAWDEIASIMWISASECSNRWLRLRQYFIKERSKIKNETTTGSGRIKRKRWELFEDMSFLDDKILQRKTFGCFSPKENIPPLSKTTTSSNNESQGLNISYVENEDFQIIDFDESMVDEEPSSKGTNMDRSSVLKESTPNTIKESPSETGYLCGRKQKTKTDPVESAIVHMNQHLKSI